MVLKKQCQIFFSSNMANIGDLDVLTLYSPTSQNGQTVKHVFDHFVGLALKGFIL